jgi:hypothetical protein
MAAMSSPDTETKPDVVRLVVGTPALAAYVEGALMLDTRDRIKIMRYCSAYLENDDPEISSDAFIEFMKSTDSDIRKGALSVAADRLRTWLNDAHTPQARLRFYAFVLAQWGNDEDAELLRKLIDKTVKDANPPLFDGILTAYTILNPRKGWTYTSELLKDPTATFMARYSALRAARYFHLSQPEVVSDKEILKALSSGLEQRDMADLVIGYLREWRYWKLSDEILGLYARRGFDAPIIRRSIVQYAMQCPHPQTVAFIAKLRTTDAAIVKDCEDILGIEAKPTPASR